MRKVTYGTWHRWLGGPAALCSSLCRSSGLPPSHTARTPIWGFAYHVSKRGMLTFLLAASECTYGRLGQCLSVYLKRALGVRTDAGPPEAITTQVPIGEKSRDERAAVGCGRRVRGFDVCIFWGSRCRDSPSATRADIWLSSLCVSQRPIQRHGGSISC